jgi:hypothetical protein
MYKQYLQKTMRRQYLMNKRSVLTENLFWVMIQISKGHAKMMSKVFVFWTLYNLLLHIYEVVISCVCDIRVDPRNDLQSQSR